MSTDAKKKVGVLIEYVENRPTIRLHLMSDYGRVMCHCSLAPGSVRPTTMETDSQFRRLMCEESLRQLEPVDAGT